jgi:hypothetical protein
MPTPVHPHPSYDNAMAEGERSNALDGDYSELLASSVFCLVLQGDGWSARMDDSVAHG